jgi:hypothetical protein
MILQRKPGFCAALYLQSSSQQDMIDFAAGLEPRLPQLPLQARAYLAHPVPGVLLALDAGYGPKPRRSIKRVKGADYEILVAGHVLVRGHPSQVEFSVKEHRLRESGHQRSPKQG